MNEIDSNDIPEATKELSKTIKPIGKDTVHKICSGQVVLSLAIAVKELVENSLDAGATSIEVKLKEHGSESIIVSDNGSGVEESNFEGMTAKYHTSKITEFSDLEDVETFGFRGEALSSLCALSDMTITTRHKTSEYATKLELDHNGNINQKTPCAREIGTTVQLQNLFSTLPVRKRDFLKNIKKEFTRMCQILQAYCLVSKNVRIVCTNQNSKGIRTTFLNTFGSKTILENIESIFGRKQTKDLIEMKSICNDNERITKELLLDDDDLNSSLDINQDDIEKINLMKFNIDGWISSCKHGCGRSSRDRQYIFINSRPCEPKNITKLINDIYHRYNSHQSPFLYLNILIERSDVDVNLTPDKRQLLINNEKFLLLIIKRSLLKTFDNIPSTFQLQNSRIDETNSNENDDDDDDDRDDEEKFKPNSQKFLEIFSQWKSTGNTDEPCKPIKKANKRKNTDEIHMRTLKMKKIQSFLTQNVTTKGLNDSNLKEETFVSYKSDKETDNEDEVEPISTKNRTVESKEFDALINSNGDEEVFKFKEKSLITDSEDNEEYEINCKIKEKIKERRLIFEKIQSQKRYKIENLLENDENQSENDENQSENDENQSKIELLIESDNDENEDEEEDLQEFSQKITINCDDIKKLLIKEENSIKEKNLRNQKLKRLKFKTEINPIKNKNAEDELEREINKEMFHKMNIIGQFNLGFIIVKLETDLFIIDQHATDEKYNFENLQKTTILNHQILTIPQNLDLTAVNEMILIDNLNVFEANGFKFDINQDAPVTKKVKLLGKPFSKNWDFGKEDIDELIFMLQDAPTNTMCRPSRVRSMFASRACRKSVMIGKALSNSTMRKLVDHMGEIEHPWNCPHGRPTMRHLINLEMLKDNENEVEN